MGNEHRKRNPNNSVNMNSSNVKFIIKEHGPGILLPLEIWVRKYWFPLGGSFSGNQLQQLGDQLYEEDYRIQSKCRPSKKERETAEMHRQAFTLWKEEAEKRNTK